MDTIQNDTILAENIHGTGALPKKKDFRDLKYASVATASLPFDWNAGFDVGAVIDATLGNTPFTTPTKNQGPSGSCGGQGGSYYEAVLKLLNVGSFDEKSAKNIYSQIFYPGGGTTLRDILNLLTMKGAASESLVPSYENGLPPSELFMEDTSLNASAATNALTSLGLSYAFVAPNIDAYAQAIRDNNGMIMEIQGGNNGTWLSNYPVAPVQAEWAHFLFCGKAKMINGKKMIGVHNSWGASVGENGWQWISEDYFKSGFIMEGGVIYQTSAILTAQKIKTISSLIGLLQKLKDMMFGPTKLTL